MKHRGQMSEKTIHSIFLNEKIPLKIYTPDDFSNLYKYHICIMQDGNDYYQIGRIARLSDQLHQNQEIVRTIFVGIHYNDKYDRQKKYHPAGEKRQAYEKFLTYEVVPFLDHTFPTHQTRDTRVLMGDSLAGTIALTTALLYSHTFGKVIMQSPYIDDTVLQILRQVKEIGKLYIYHTIGKKEIAVKTTDGSIKDFLAPNQLLYKQMADYQKYYQYKELPEGEHTWKHWQKDLPMALQSMLNKGK